MAGTQAAPEGHHQRPVIGQAQLFPGLGTGQVKEVAPHRGAGDDDLAGAAIVLAALLKAHHDAVGGALQHFGGEARDHVGLVDRRGDAHAGGAFYHRIAGIAAGAHHQIGTEITENGPGTAAGPGQHGQGVQVVPQAAVAQGALKAAHGNAPEGVARLFHQVALHTVGSAHKQKPGFGVLLPHVSGQSQGGVHMARRSAAGKNHFHFAAPPIRSAAQASAAKR